MVLEREINLDLISDSSQFPFLDFDQGLHDADDDDNEGEKNDDDHRTAIGKFCRQNGKNTIQLDKTFITSILGPILQ